MLNVETRIQGEKLIIEVDLSQQFGTSSSGKSAVIASTQGNVSLPERPDIKMGLNVYQPIPAGQKHSW